MKHRLCLLVCLLWSACGDDDPYLPASLDMKGQPGLDMTGPGDGGSDGRAPDLAHPLDHPDLTKIVPWKAVDLVGPTAREWEEYDYRPRAQGGLREDIDATLKRLAAIGVRQVQIQTLYSWSVETAPYAGTAVNSTVYYDKNYRVDDPQTWGKVPRNRRGDMGLVAYSPPASWDQPTQLKGPTEINARAEKALGDMLDAVAANGLIPVLKSEVYLSMALSATDFSGWFNYTDPSRNFDQFYAMYKQHLIDMTRLAARHQAAMLILGTEIPYVAGAGLSRFADGSKMTDKQAAIYAKWKDIIKAVRDTARAEGRPDLVLSYTEINPWGEERPITEAAVPIWSRVPFWDDLDAVGINFYLPGRWSDGLGGYDKGPKTADDMVTYGETHDFASDTVPNLKDLKDFFVTKKGYGLATKPIFFAEDGCSSTPTGAANPAEPPFLTLRSMPDFAEQQHLYEAHFKLAEKYGKGWLAGLGFWQVTPSSRWGGSFNKNDTTNYSVDNAYFDFLSTPTQDTVRTYFARY